MVLGQLGYLARLWALYPVYSAALTQLFGYTMTGRQLLLMLLPTAVFGVIVYLSVSGYYAMSFADIQRDYGQATSGQMAEHLVQYVVEEDLLSLNVVASRLVDERHVTSVSVYDEKNRLIAQAGRINDDDAAYASEMSFQDAVVGSVRVGVKSAEAPTGNIILILIGLFPIYALVIWRFQDLLAGLRQLTEDTEETVLPEAATVTPVLSIAEDAPVEHCLLVVRIRSAHQMRAHFDKFYQAARIYHGIVEQTTTEELVIHFEGADAMFLGTCAGYLIRETAKLAGPNVRFGGTLSEAIRDSESTAAADRQRKAASYLASIAENELLITSGVNLVGDRVELQPFHHALVDSDDLKKVTDLSTRATLESQARELTARVAVSS